jgi:hypothetical protein
MEDKRKSGKPSRERIRFERRSTVRFPVTLFVDQIEFDPVKYEGNVVRTAYDLELTEYDMKKLYEELKIRLEKPVVIPTTIRVTGRLVS